MSKAQRSTLINDANQTSITSCINRPSTNNADNFGTGATFANNVRNSYGVNVDNVLFYNAQFTKTYSSSTLDSVKGCSVEYNEHPAEKLYCNEAGNDRHDAFKTGRSRATNDVIIYFNN